MHDQNGYRKNVGIILCNAHKKVFLAKRIHDESAWQFPQGGIKGGESPLEAMYRELYEEIGLLPSHVEILGQTKDWLYYDVPKIFLRNTSNSSQGYRGQKQIWFLLRFIGQDNDISLRTEENPEFDAWRWNQYWNTIDDVIEFKREVYRSALKELAVYL